MSSLGISYLKPGVATNHNYCKFELTSCSVLFDALESEEVGEKCLKSGNSCASDNRTVVGGGYNISVVSSFEGRIE